jgi:hypothetical protein
MAELRGAVGPNWVRLVGGELTAAELDEALSWAGQPRHGGAPLGAFSWPEVGARTVAAYRATLARRRVEVPG